MVNISCVPVMILYNIAFKIVFFVAVVSHFRLLLKFMIYHVKEIKHDFLVSFTTLG